MYFTITKFLSLLPYTLSLSSKAPFFQKAPTLPESVISNHVVTDRVLYMSGSSIIQGCFVHLLGCLPRSNPFTSIPGGRRDSQGSRIIGAS